MVVQFPPLGPSRVSETVPGSFRGEKATVLAAQQSVIAEPGMSELIARLEQESAENARLRAEVERLHGVAATSSHSEIVVMLDRLREHAKGLPAKALSDFEAVTDSIETLTRAYMVPEIAFDWSPYRLSPVEQRLAEYLRVKMGKVCSKERMHAALYSDRIDDGPDLKVIDVLVCHIRQKFRDTDCPFGISVSWGQGYVMTDKASAYESLASRFLPADPKTLQWRGFRIPTKTMPFLSALEAGSPNPVSMAHFVAKDGRNSVAVRLHHLRRRLLGHYEIRCYPNSCYALLPLTTRAHQALKAA